MLNVEMCCHLGSRKYEGKQQRISVFGTKANLSLSIFLGVFLPILFVVAALGMV